jgi:fructokinase
MSYQVICFGEILWDCFKAGKKAGGAPMNVALHLHKQGINSTLISAVGNDDDGKELLVFIKEGGLNTDYVQIDDTHPTGTVDVQLDEKNQATYTIVKPVAWDNIKYHKEFDLVVQNADAVVFGSLASRENTSKETLVELIKSAQLKVFDMNLRPPHFEKKTLENLLHQTDVLKINEDELSFLGDLFELDSSSEQEILMDLSTLFHFKIICVTLGERGAMVWQEGKIHSHHGYKIEVADTVGAGDAFLATFIKGILHKDPIEQVLKLACATGAFVASRYGANPDYTEADIINIQET